VERFDTINHAFYILNSKNYVSKSNIIDDELPKWFFPVLVQVSLLRLTFKESKKIIPKERINHAFPILNSKSNIFRELIELGMISIQSELISDFNPIKPKSVK